jgi:hypothetical protein
MKYYKPDGMKKILVFFISILFVASVSGQSGSGTLGDPYYGTISSGSPVWDPVNFTNGEVYVGSGTLGEDLTINGGHLTILPGIKVIFMRVGSDLIINSAGQLTADGTPANQITFTRYYPTNNYWGHIAFQSTAGTSLIDNCIIEYGNVTGNSSPSFYGGAIYADINNLTISNCKIQHNRAEWGGGIFVNANKSPSIETSYFYDNFSKEGGGGIYLWNHANSVIKNCIFDSNHCDGTTFSYYTGGGLASQSSGSIQVLNCTFVNNSSSRPNGQSVMLYSSVNNLLQNCIIWGTTGNHIYLTGTNTIQYCGVEGSLPAGTGNLLLSSNNNDATGPNFTNPSASDWSITFISPCRDAGTTPSPPIPTDFIGNPRVGPYDIGAYEVQYILSTWTGATSSDWDIATNWNPNIVPFATSHVTIPPAANNPAISFSDVTINDMLIESGASLSVNALRTLTAATVTNSGALSIINSGRFNVTSLLNEAVFTVGPTSWATITTLTNNGIINLNSDFIDMFSLMFDTYSGTGTANIAMSVTGGGGTDNWKWHYVAVPINYRNNKTMFTSIDAVDLMQYDDFQIPNTLTATDNDGWVWHDGYRAGPPPDLLGPSFSNLFVGKGYAFYHPNSSAVVNFSNLSSLQSSLGPLFPQYSGNGKLVPGNYGWNLLGNSLTCGIDWDLVTRTGNVNSAIYYTINYKIGTYVQGSGGIGINGATKNVPALQGFLVKANETGTSLDFSSARQNTSQHRYKKSLEVKGSDDSKGNNSVVPLIKLELNNSGNQDETLIWFNDQATNSFDRDFDALKLFSGGAFDQIYTLNGTQKFGISGIPFPTESVTIPVVVKVVNAGSNYKIIASQLQGLDNYNLTLTDKGNSNFITDLKTAGSYTFSSNAGTFPDRFVITIGTVATGVSDVIIPDKVFNVFTFDRTLNIEVLNDAWEGKKGTINLYNLTGIKVLQQNNIEWYKGDIKKIPLNLPQGIYIVEIKAENQKFVTKISIIK